MKIDANPSEIQNLSAEIQGRISGNDKRVLEGMSEVIVSPQFENVDDIEIKSFVTDLISKGRMTDYLVEIENANLSKLGPRSIATPWSERRQSLMEYFKVKNDAPDRFSSYTNLGDLRPVSLETVSGKLLRSSTTGLPYLKRKGDAIDEGLVYTTEPGVYPCMLYTRTQEQGKTRNVWGYPFGDTIWEQQFHMPWLEFEKRMPSRTALLGPDHVDRAISDLLFAKAKSDTIYCADFSAYDASVSTGLAHQAFDFISKHFQKQHSEEIFDLFHRFTTIPILTPEGSFEGHHGVPSGSSFTNTIDSLVQLFVSGMWKKSQVQGDDGVYLVQDRDVELLNQRFIDAGLKINIDKSERFSSHEAVYLQRYYHPDYTSPNGGLGGVYSIARALARLKYLERFVALEPWKITGGDYFTLRAIMILENCKYHPHFREIVEFVHSLDTTGLRYSDEGLSIFSRMQESRARAGVLNQYGDYVKSHESVNFERGIHSFDVVKLLRTL